MATSVESFLCRARGRIIDDNDQQVAVGQPGEIAFQNAAGSPVLVEKELAEHARVDDVFVYGVPSSNGVAGEKDVVTAIVPRSPATSDAADGLRWCRSRLESSFVVDAGSIAIFHAPVSGQIVVDDRAVFAGEVGAEIIAADI